jgi:hypothetical protein
MTFAIPSDVLTAYRAPGKFAKLYAAILTPPTIYTARINQTFSTYDGVLSITYDGGSGTLANVLPDMEVWIGSTAGAHDKGICRLRDRDATKFYLSETSEITFADNDYITIVAAYGVWARPVRITAAGVVYMDETLYTDQHSNWDPMPNMGAHRVLELTGASVSATFHGSASFCPGSSISTYAWSCATASAASNTTTTTPTFQFNTTGWHTVYLTVTAANGKSFFGVRYVYVWNEDNPPRVVEITQPGRCDVDSGGWEIGLTMHQDADLTQVYERAMVILFSKEYYAGVEAAYGPVVGAENILFVGWIAEENNLLSSEAGTVSFRACGAAYWMNHIPSWPDGIQLVGTANAWTNTTGLTVDKGVYHFLRWRTTVTRVMDVALTDDTRLTQEVSSSAKNLWSQLQEMTWNQIYARPGVNALNQLYIQIHPCLIPSASRTYPTVMAITKADIRDDIEFDRSIIPPVGIVDMSGVIVTGPNIGTAKFALSPGHSLPHHGDWDIQPNLLLSSQAQVITLAGLYRSWQNAQFKDIPLTFMAPNHFIDCFPNQKCTIAISSADNERGFSYSGGIIPTSVSMEYDADQGYLYLSAHFEEETIESSAIQGDTPGSGDTDGPTDPTLPELPEIPPIIPGGGGEPTASPVKILAWDTEVGLVYTEDFDQAIPTWITVNGGLTITQYQHISQMVVTPTGAVYVADCYTGDQGCYIAYAPSIGGTFTVIEDKNTILAKLGGIGSGTCFVAALGVNPLSGTVAYVIGSQTGASAYTAKLYIGTGTSFSAGATITGIGGGSNNASIASLTYGAGKWLFTSCASSATDKQFWRISGDGSSMELTQDIGDGYTAMHIRASTLGKTWHIPRFDNTMEYGDNNCATVTNIGSLMKFGFDRWDHNQIAVDPSGTYMMALWTTGTTSGKSSDGGTTWVSAGSIPVGGRCFAYAGPGTGGPRFVAGGATVYYTPNFGVDWYNQTGNLGSISTTPELKLINVVEF